MPLRGELTPEQEAWLKSRGSRKQADMFGNSDEPHNVAQPDVANSSGNTPNPSTGYQDGVKDALADDQPTYGRPQRSGSATYGFDTGCVPPATRMYSPATTQASRNFAASRVTVPSRTRSSRWSALTTNFRTYSAQPPRAVTFPLVNGLRIRVRNQWPTHTPPR